MYHQRQTVDRRRYEKLAWGALCRARQQTRRGAAIIDAPCTVLQLLGGEERMLQGVLAKLAGGGRPVGPCVSRHHLLGALVVAHRLGKLDELHAARLIERVPQCEGASAGDSALCEHPSKPGGVTASVHARTAGAAAGLPRLGSGRATKPSMACRQKGHCGTRWSWLAHSRRAQEKHRSWLQPATCGCGVGWGVGCV